MAAKLVSTLFERSPKVRLSGEAEAAVDAIALPDCAYFSAIKPAAATAPIKTKL